ncbi:MAG: hypothetical protein JXR85_11495 [Deltaproteobacteria bacterium]|nr:hypothetical protein [Deltaproteobacteria bacterium]
MSDRVKETGGFKELTWDIISSGLPADHDIEVLRKIVLTNMMFVVAFFVLSVFCVVAYSETYYLLCIVDAALFLFLIGIFFYLRKTKDHQSSSLLCIIALGGFCLFCVVYAGIHNTTIYIWAFVYPLLALFLLGTVRGSFYTLLFLGIVCMIFIADRYVAFLIPNPIENEIRFGAVYITIYLIAFVMEKVRRATQDQLNSLTSKLAGTISEKEDLIQELQNTIDEVTVLRGILPICSQCKKIRDDKGYWHQVEAYVRTHSEADFTHGLCPDCMRELYPDMKTSDKIPE